MKKNDRRSGMAGLPKIDNEAVFPLIIEVVLNIYRFNIFKKFVQIGFKFGIVFI